MKFILAHGIDHWICRNFIFNFE